MLPNVYNLCYQEGEIIDRKIKEDGVLDSQLKTRKDLCLWTWSPFYVGKIYFGVEKQNAND